MSKYKVEIRLDDISEDIDRALGDYVSRMRQFFIDDMGRNKHSDTKAMLTEIARRERIHRLFRRRLSAAKK